MQSRLAQSRLAKSRSSSRRPKIQTHTIQTHATQTHAIHSQNAKSSKRQATRGRVTHKANMSSNTPTGRGTSQHIRVRTTRSGVAQSPEAQLAPELPAPVGHVGELRRQESKESEVSINSDQDKDSGGESDDLHDVGKHGAKDTQHESRAAAEDSENDDYEPIASAEASGSAARPAEPTSESAARPAEPASEFAARPAEPASVDLRPGQQSRQMDLWPGHQSRWGGNVHLRWKDLRRSLSGCLACRHSTSMISNRQWQPNRLPPAPHKRRMHSKWRNKWRTSRPYMRRKWPS